MDVDKVIEDINLSGLKGWVGQGFRLVKNGNLFVWKKSPRLMTINGDEGEPGTFKDKLYLENNIHQFFEGMLIAAWAVDAKDVYIYMRDEYPEIRIRMFEELEKIKSKS